MLLRERPSWARSLRHPWPLRPLNHTSLAEIHDCVVSELIE